jgi:hypothetical protein
MNSIFDQEKPRLSDPELFSRIWTNPQKVFRFLEDHRYNKYIAPLLILSGILSGWDGAFIYALRDGGNLAAPLLKIARSILGISLFCLIYAALMSWTGRLLQVRNSTASLLRVIAHARMPSLAGSLIVSVLQVYRMLRYIDDGIRDEIVHQVSATIVIIANLWTLVLYIIGTMEVQGLPVGKAIINILLPVPFIAIPLGIAYFSLF